MGGQQAYYWAVMHGSGDEPFLKNAVVICGSAKTAGINYAFLEGPISSLETSYGNSLVFVDISCWMVLG